MTPDDLWSGDQIVLEGVIVRSGIESWVDGGVITPSLVRRALARADGDVIVRVNSPGGDPAEGEAIRVAFQEHPGRVTVRVAGDAMSAASLMIMGADRIEMSRGSVMMIHDPATFTFGTVADHQETAEWLDISADAYAAVYAERSGKDPIEMRALMRGEIFMDAQAAVDGGFADAIMTDDAGRFSPPDPDDMATARERVAQAMRMASRPLPHGGFVSARSGRGVGEVPGEAIMPLVAAGGRQPAAMAVTQEVAMDPEDQPVADAPETQIQSPPAQINPQVVLMQERARQHGIRTMARPFVERGQLRQVDVDAVIDAGTSEADAAQTFLQAMSSAQPAVTRPERSPATIARDETDTQLEGMIGALMGQTEGPATEFCGLRLRSLAAHLGRGSGQTFDEVAAIRRGMSSTTMMSGGAHGVSDFAYITTEVMNRTLIADYQRRDPNWAAVTGAPPTAADFREIHAVRFGGDFQLKPVTENGEYTEAVLNDEAEGLTVERRGRTISITFEAVVNDDMGAFMRIPRDFAMSARVMEASIVWGLIRSNAKLKSDNTALFHASHGNLAGSGAAISATTVGAGRKAMWEQTAYGSKDKDDFLMIQPDLLLVPPALEMVAGQFVAAVTPSTDAEANPFKATVQPVVVAHLGASAGGSDTSWYMISSDMPPISHAYLDGYAAPTIQTTEGINPDKVTMNARHIFGAAATEFRGAYKNPGS